MIDTEALRKKVMDLAIRGKLTEQLPSDGDAATLYAQILDQKSQMIKEGKIKRDKELPEIVADEIPFEIPDNWKWVRLGDVCTKVSSGNTPTGGSKGGAYVENGFCFFREQNIYNDGIHNEGMVFITEELLDSRPNSTVQAKDILLNITGGSIGRCALIPDDFSKGSTNQHILIIRPLDTNIRFYVHKCLCGPYYQSLIMGNVVGDKDGFSAGRCKSTIIPLPPLEEQKRIIQIVDAILAQIDIIDTLQQQYESNLSILKSMIIDAGIQGKLTERLPEDGDAEDLYAQILDQKSQMIKEGKIKKEKPLPDIATDEIPFEIPKNWKWVRLPSLFYQVGNKNNQIQSNQLLSEGKYPAISQGKKPIDGYTNESNKVITEVPLVLFGDHTRNVKYIGEPFVICADGTQLLKPIAVDCVFFYYVIWLISANITSRGYSRHFSLLKKALFPLPPMAEQKRIVESIKSIMEQID